MRLFQLPPLHCSLCRTASTNAGLSSPKYVNSAQGGKENFEKCFEKSHVKTSLFQKFLLGVGSGVISITSPSRGDMIAVMGEVTGFKAWEYIQTKMLQSNEGKQILEEKPRISSGSIDIEKLKSYPNGTLGKAYSNFLEKYGYTPDTRNAVQFVDDLELAYVAQRYREAHDLFHTVLDMPTNMLGEVTVKWVEAIQLKLPMCAAGALFGSVRLAPKFSRSYSTKIDIKLDSSLTEKIKNNEISPRAHPGVMRLPCVSLPEKISNSVNSLLTYEKKEFVQDAKDFKRKVDCRRLPVEKAEMGRIKKEYANFLREQQPAPLMDLEWEMIMEEKLNRRLKYVCYNWKPLIFDKKTSRQYLLSRAPGEYAVLKRVFNEIYKRDNEFAPKTLLDFGSGVGTVSWAANGFWGKTLNEYYCVDASSEMNELAAMILRCGDTNNPPLIDNVYFRHYLPSSKKPFDIVVSAFSFFELRNCEQRLRTLSSLWNNTTNYLVLIENGTYAGFDVLIEARDFLVNVSKEHNVDCYIFAPCPHELECPRLNAPGKKKPCVFPATYMPLRKFDKSRTHTMKFSYLIMKKGPKPPDNERQYRLVGNVLKRHKHAVCQMCTNDGELNRLFVTALGYGKEPYKCVRFSYWGDLIPGTCSKKYLESGVDEVSNISSEHEETFDDNHHSMETNDENTSKSSTDRVDVTFSDTSNVESHKQKIDEDPTK